MIKVNLKEKCLVDCNTGEIYRPECWETLVVYHAYLVSKKYIQDADKLLEDVFAGKKVISKMVEKYNIV